MATKFNLPHIDISRFRDTTPYTGTGSPGGGSVRVRAEHGRRLQAELNAALELTDLARSDDPRLPDPVGSYLEVELHRSASVDNLERKTDKIRPGAVKLRDNGNKNVALFVPDAARAAFREILSEYTDGPLTDGGNPKRQTVVEAIENFRQAKLETFWTDESRPLPEDRNEQMWWALWCRRDSDARIENLCERLGVRAASKDRWLTFPESIVIPVFADRVAIELMIFVSGDIAELRYASDNPVFFTDEVRDSQGEWTNELAERVTWPPSDAPSVCLLDTGVNRAHWLIEPALAVSDLHSVNVDWGTDDHDARGHGTAMAGMALFGDLTAPLGDRSEPILTHRLESVKLLPPQNMGTNEPQNYGAITQSAISLPEIQAPNRKRAYCMAVSNDEISGSIPSTWSAAIDQAASGSMIGDGDDRPRRLIVISTGNVKAEIDADRVQHPDDCAAEDPAQAWNALTIGGYTDLGDVQDAGYDDWTALSSIGDVSPHSRTSVTWPQSKVPFKPELVLEAGNRALNPAKTEALTLDSLSLLSTGKDVGGMPLVPFQATSAASAQAGRLAARLISEHDEYWPETIRALMVHSAEWTGAMKAEFLNSNGSRENYPLVRRYGYGVPDFDRANASANDQLALVAQSEIQPFHVRGGRKFNECHYYQLPLPNNILEQMDNTPVELKVTLSYFVEPNPGLSANIDPQRYQSHGLRFDLQRKRETVARFKSRVNAAEEQGGANEPDDGRWLLGPQSVSSGSLHCDVWTGPAVELLGREMLCIKPVIGWWRNRSSVEVCNQKTRYALVVTLKSSDVEVDLYTAVQTRIGVENTVSVEI